MERYQLQGNNLEIAHKPCQNIKPGKALSLPNRLLHALRSLYVLYLLLENFTTIPHLMHACLYTQTRREVALIFHMSNFFLLINIFFHSLSVYVACSLIENSHGECFIVTTTCIINVCFFLGEQSCIVKTAWTLA